MERLRPLWLSLALIFSMLPLIGADSVGGPDPIVVVYPLMVAGSLGDADAGGKLATLVAQRVAVAGGVVVKPYIPGTARKDYLAAARAQSADYYVTGYLTPLGDEVSLVSQIVSTYSGTVIWSQSALVKTYADADSQASAIRDAILRREGRYLASINAPSAAPEATVRPEKGEGGFSFGGHRRRQGTTASPAPSASGRPSSAGAAQVGANAGVAIGGSAAAAPAAATGGTRVAQAGSTPPPYTNSAPNAGQLLPPRASTVASPTASISPATASPLPTDAATAVATVTPAGGRAHGRRTRNAPIAAPPLAATPPAAPAPAMTAAAATPDPGLGTAPSPAAVHSNPPQTSQKPFGRGSPFGKYAVVAQRHSPHRSAHTVGRAPAVVAGPSGLFALVLHVAGNAQSSERSYAGSALASALARGGRPSRTSSDASSLAPEKTRELCARHPGVATIYATSLSVQRTDGAYRHTAATLDVTGYDCSGSLLGRQHVVAVANGAKSATDAIDRATARAVSGILREKAAGRANTSPHA